MYKISRLNLIDAVLYAQDKKDNENYPWLLTLYRSALGPEIKDELSLDDLNQNQMEVLIEYLIKSNSYGEDTDPQNLDDLIQCGILMPVKENNVSGPVKSMKPKKD